MEEARKKRLIESIAGTVIAHADELTALDQAIGDGDHGLNMRRGFEAVLADAPALAAKPLPDLLKAVGMTLVMRVGGASGPLYGTLAMGLGKALAALPASSPAPSPAPWPSRADVATALESAIGEVKARGKSEPGQKTLLDVLVPVQALLAAGGDDLSRRVAQGARAAAEATIPLRAIRGRASFLGERSVGHMDPGARSISLIIAALCDELRG